MSLSLQDQLAGALGTVDALLDVMPEHQVLGLCACLRDDPKINSRIARLILLCHHHALNQIDEAERIAYQSQFTNNGDSHHG